MASTHDKVNYTVAKQYAVWKSSENTLDQDGRDPLSNANVPTTKKEILLPQANQKENHHKVPHLGMFLLLAFLITLLSSLLSVGFYTAVEHSHQNLAKEIETIRPASAIIEHKSTTEEVIENVIPCVVTIVKENDNSNESSRYGSAGTGFIIDSDENVLYVLTSYHVAEQFKTITVTFYDGATAPADLSAFNEKMDLGLLTVPIARIPRGTTPRIAVFGTDTLARGQEVILLGNSLGFGLSASTGIISALDRQITLTDPHTNNSFTVPCIQTDAPINPGNSGGPLFNTKGEVIGMVESKYSDTGVEGIGYAIPIDEITPLIGDLVDEKSKFLQKKNVAFDELYIGCTEVLYSLCSI